MKNLKREICGIPYERMMIYTRKLFEKYYINGYKTYYHIRDTIEEPIVDITVSNVWDHACDKLKNFASFI